MRYRDYEITFDPPPFGNIGIVDWKYTSPSGLNSGYGSSFLDCCRQVDSRYMGIPRVEYYKIGDGGGSWLEVPHDMNFFDVSYELGEGHCDECELPLEVCACEDAREWEELQRAYGIPERFIMKPTPSLGLHIQQFGRILRPRKPGLFARMWARLTGRTI